MMTTPPTILTQGVEKRTLPIQPAVAPSSMKMSETPALKASELMMTARRAAEREPVALALQVFDAHARDERDVAGDERQHARRQKRQQPRGERNQNGNVRAFHSG